MGSTHPLVSDHMQTAEFIYTQSMNQAKDLQVLQLRYLENFPRLERHFSETTHVHEHMASTIFFFLTKTPLLLIYAAP